MSCNLTGDVREGRRNISSGGIGEPIPRFRRTGRRIMNRHRD